MKTSLAASSALTRRGLATYVPTEKVLYNAFNREFQLSKKKWSRDIEINTMKAGMAFIKSRGFELVDVEGGADMKLHRVCAVANTITKNNDGEDASESAAAVVVTEEANKEQQYVSMTIDFDIWSRCAHSGRNPAPEAYDVIVRKLKTNAPDAAVDEDADCLVVTCVNHPQFLPVGCRIVPRGVDVSNMEVYGGPKFTRLPEKLMVSYQDSVFSCHYVTVINFCVCLSSMTLRAQGGLIKYLNSIGVDEEMGSFIHMYVDFKVRREMHRALGETLQTVLKPE